MELKQMRLKKKKESLVPLDSYRYRPCRGTSGEYYHYDCIFQQFYILCEALYDPTGSIIVAIRYWKLVADRTHSDSALWLSTIKENQKMYTNSHVNAMPHSSRKATMEKLGKQQRVMADKNKLDTHAEMMYQWVRTTAHVEQLYAMYGGSLSGGGAPLLDHPAKDLPRGCVNHELFGHETLGGQHPLAPEWMLNARRPGNNPLMAGLLDETGGFIKTHPQQQDRLSYFNPETGRYIIPEFVKQKGCLFLLSSPVIKTPFKATLPFEIHGSLRPDDCLLKLYYDQFKEKDSILAEAIRETPDAAWCAHKQELLSGITSLMTRAERGADELSKRMHSCRLLSEDSTDLTPEELRSIKEMTISINKSTGKGELRPRESMRELSKELKNVHDMILAWDKDNTRVMDAMFLEIAKKEVENPSMDAPCPSDTDPLLDGISTLKAVNASIRNQYMTAIIKLGLEKMDAAFQSRASREDIPPGWLTDYDDLQRILKKISDIPKRKDGKNHIVDPSNARKNRGTAAIGFATNYRIMDMRMSPYANYIQWQMHLFSNTCGIDGREVANMVGIYDHSFQKFQEASTIKILAGKPGRGKSMRPKRLMRIMPNGWFVKTGSNSAKSGTCGKWDSTCGTAKLVDEATKDLDGSVEGERLEQLKQELSDGCCQRSRAVKGVDIHGRELFSTQIDFTIHYETIILSTNLAWLLIRQEKEPSTSQWALVQRSQCDVVFDCGSECSLTDKEFEKRISDHEDDVLRQQLVALLVGMCLIFVKEMDFLDLDFDIPERMMGELDAALKREFGIPPPDSRIRQQRTMNLRKNSYEEKIIHKFFYRETSYQYSDMRPDEKGFLQPFSFTQLADVIKEGSTPSLEVILRSWSTAHDFAFATSPQAFHVMTMVAAAHGVQIDAHSFSNVLGATQKSHQCQVDLYFNGKWRSDNLMRTQAPDSPGLLEGQIQSLAKHHEMKRKVRLSFMRRCLKGMAPHDRTLEPWKAMESVWGSSLTATEPDNGSDMNVDEVLEDENGCTSNPMKPKPATGFMFPDLQDVLNSGYKNTAILKWLEGHYALTSDDFTDSRFGTWNDVNGGDEWGFTLKHKDGSRANAAAYDPSWRTIVSTEKIEKDKAWGRAQRLLTQNASNECNTIKSAFDLSATVIRDTLVQLSEETRSVQLAVSARMPVEHNYKKAMTAKTCDNPHTEGDPVEAQENVTHIRAKGAYKWYTNPINTESDPAMRPATSTETSPIVQQDIRDGMARAAEVTQRSDVVQSIDYEKMDASERLQELVNNGSLPGVAPLLSSEVTERKFLYIDNQTNNLVVSSSHIINHAQLVVECALQLSLIPELQGATGANKVPGAFQARTSGRSTQSTSNQRYDEANVASRTSLPTLEGHHQVGPNRLYESTGTFDDENRGVQAGVSNPDTSSSSLPHASPGASSQSSQPTEKKVERLAFSWDMFSIFLAKTAIDKFANDDTDIVKQYKKIAPDIFTKSVEEEIQNMPRISTRFPNYIKDCKEKHLADMKPLCFSLKQSTQFFVEASPSHEWTIDAMESARRQVSIAEGRPCTISDPSVQKLLSQKASMREVKATGNLFHASTWKQAAINSLIARGMAGSINDDVLQRVTDTGTFLKLRLQMALALQNRKGVRERIDDWDDFMLYEQSEPAPDGIPGVDTNKLLESATLISAHQQQQTAVEDHSLRKRDYAAANPNHCQSITKTALEAPKKRVCPYN